MLGLLPTLERGLFLGEVLAAIALLALARWRNRTHDYLAADTWAIPGRTPVAGVQLAFVLLTASVVLGAAGNMSSGPVAGVRDLEQRLPRALLIATRRLLEGVWAFRCA